MEEILVADLEGNGLLDTLTKIWIISIGDENGRVQSYYDGSPHGGVETGFRRLRAARRTVWHNGLGYDIPALHTIFGEGAEQLVPGCIDTLVLSKLDNPDREGTKPHSLESWGHRLGYHKVPDLDWTKWSPDMIPRCEGDVAITAKLFNHLKHMLVKQPQAVAIEHPCAWETTLIVHRGMMLDEEMAKQLLDQFMIENEGREREMRHVFPPILIPAKKSDPEKTLTMINKNHLMHGLLEPGSPYCPLVVQEFNPGSRQQIADRLISKYKWKPTQYTPGGAPKINGEVMADLTYDEAPLLQQYLDTQKMISQINSPIKKDGTGGGWLQHVRPSGRVHAGLNPLGTVTGRPSCSSPNVQQVSTDKRMRACWRVQDDCVQVGVDVSGLELRVLAHYLWRLDNGSFAAHLLEGDIHTDMQHAWGFYDRHETKRGEYGWLYGAFNPKLGSIAFRDAYLVDKEIRYDVLGLSPEYMRGINDEKKRFELVGAEMRRIIEKEIPGVKELIDDVQLVARTQKFLRGLDGRILHVRRDYAALNTLIQSAGIIIVKKAMCLIPDMMKEAGIDCGKIDFTKAAEWYKRPFDAAMIMWVHDEIQFESRPDCAELVGQIATQAVVEAGKQLGFRVRLDCDVNIGQRWSETH